MSRFTEAVIAHGSVVDLANNVLYCACGEHFMTLASHAEHLESVLAGAGVVAVELPAQSGDPFRARDIVERAAIMRQQYRAERCAGPLSWGRATDAQKVHWIIRAAADLSAAAASTPGERDD